MTRPSCKNSNTPSAIAKAYLPKSANAPPTRWFYKNPLKKLRAVVIGNASHALHPVAGQGLNLGLRDVAQLADLLAQAAQTQQDVGASELLETYETLRKADYATVVRYTDSLVRLFSTDFMPLNHARAGGLLAVDRIPLVRQWFTRQSMGLRHRQSRLARGLALKC